MSRRTHRSRTAIAGVVNIEHPLRALVLAAVLAAAAHVGLGAVGEQFRSDGAGDGGSVMVTYDAAPGARLAGPPLSMT
jgi:hypothetical protein